MVALTTKEIMMKKALFCAMIFCSCGGNNPPCPAVDAGIAPSDKSIAADISKFADSQKTLYVQMSLSSFSPSGKIANGDEETLIMIDAAAREREVRIIQLVFETWSRSPYAGARRFALYADGNPAGTAFAELKKDATAVFITNIRMAAGGKAELALKGSIAGLGTSDRILIRLISVVVFIDFDGKDYELQNAAGLPIDGNLLSF